MKIFLFRFKHGKTDWTVLKAGEDYLFKSSTGTEFSCISWQEGRQSINEGYIT